MARRHSTVARRTAYQAAQERGGLRSGRMPVGGPERSPSRQERLAELADREAFEVERLRAINPDRLARAAAALSRTTVLSLHEAWDEVRWVDGETE